MPITLTKATTTSGGSSDPVEVIISHVDDSIRIGDGTNLADVTADGELQVSDAALVGSFNAPIAANAVTMAYPDDVTEVYTYHSGGAAGPTVMTITVIYTDDTKSRYVSVVRS